MNWQPIETAPKDGTDIVVGFDVASVWIVHIAWFRDADAVAEMKMCGNEEADETFIGWWSYTTGSVSQEMLDGYRTPTHWIPLPEMPK